MGNINVTGGIEENVQYECEERMFRDGEEVTVASDGDNYCSIW